jgi:hypothetical protein
MHESVEFDPPWNVGVRECVIAQPLVTADELDALQSGLRRHLEDPTTYVVSHVFSQAWGLKPS